MKMKTDHPRRCSYFDQSNFCYCYLESCFLQSSLCMSLNIRKLRSRIGEKFRSTLLALSSVWEYQSSIFLSTEVSKLVLIWLYSLHAMIWRNNKIFSNGSFRIERGFLLSNVFSDISPTVYKILPWLSTSSLSLEKSKPISALSPALMWLCRFSSSLSKWREWLITSSTYSTQSRPLLSALC